jgi:oxygen-independent coproporphyrinogen-3 oxidase
VSNWARSTESRSRHNLLYWTGADWWGIGPGAHSHLAGTRWWNVKHPLAYAGRLAAGCSPAAGRELLGEPARRLERVMLELRLDSGLPVDLLDQAARDALPGLVERRLISPAALTAGVVALTISGRLLADGVARALVA